MMTIDLRHRVALVTGSSAGIGKATALALSRAGAQVIICGRDQGKLKAAASEIAQTGNQVHDFILDGTKRSAVNKLFKVIKKKIGQLDILVNNLGGAEEFGSFLKISHRGWQKTYEINFLPMVYFSQGAIPLLRRSPAPRIINIASLPAHQPGFLNPHYSATKAAVLNLGKHLANVLAQDNILVNTICPNTLRGGGWDRNIRDRSRREGLTLKAAARLMEDEEKKKIPLGRLGTPQDVAYLIVFLASDYANFITGTAINVDGGTTRSML